MNNTKNGQLLPLMEAFSTIQGEGYHQGKAAYFIRLGGCDVGCHWCDVKESWDVEKFPMTRVDEIVDKATNYSSRLAVVTGGEPLMHNLEYLCTKLHDEGFQTNIETSGAYPLSGDRIGFAFLPKNLSLHCLRYWKRQTN